MSKTILIIEDSVGAARAISKVLGEEGHEVTCISGVLELHETGLVVPCTGFGAAATSPEVYATESFNLCDFNVVLLDGAPDLGLYGWELLAALPPEGMLQKRFIAISSSVQSNDRMVALGAADGCEKSNVVGIRSAVQKLVREQESASLSVF